jgi:hypothetical protein
MAIDLVKVLAELRSELANLDAAILSLERLKREDRPRRGRPPKALSELRKLGRSASTGRPVEPSGTDGGHS